MVVTKEKCGLYIVHCNKASNPVEVKHLLLCKKSVMHLLLTPLYCNHVFERFNSRNKENKKMVKIFRKLYQNSLQNDAII